MKLPATRFDKMSSLCDRRLHSLPQSICSLLDDEKCRLMFVIPYLQGGFAITFRRVLSLLAQSGSQPDLFRIFLVKHIAKKAMFWSSVMEKGQPGRGTGAGMGISRKARPRRRAPGAEAQVYQNLNLTPPSPLRLQTSPLEVKPNGRYLLAFEAHLERL